MRALLLTALVLSACSGAPGPEPTPGATNVACVPLTSCPCSGGATCDLDCGGRADCRPDCSGGGRCGVIDCSDVTGCDVICSGGTRCDYVDCRGATACAADCSDGSRCNLNCDGVTDCHATCTGGSPCLLLCTSTTSCTFAECSGGSGTASCPGNIVVCNRACPTCGDGVCDRIAGETRGSCQADCPG